MQFAALIVEPVYSGRCPYEAANLEFLLMCLPVRYHLYLSAVWKMFLLFGDISQLRVAMCMQSIISTNTVLGCTLSYERRQSYGVM